MGKITYRPVFYKRKQLNSQGKALLQVQAYLCGKRVYFSTHIYLTSGQWNAFFAVKSNTSLNHDLKIIGGLAGIGKNFTFHTARHTNATLLLYRGASITTVQKLLGHRNIATTQIYSEVMERTIVRDLTKERG